MIKSILITNNSIINVNTGETMSNQQSNQLDLTEFNVVLSEFDKVVEEIKTLRAELTEKFKVVVKNFFNTTFKQFPELESVCWHQYTPYWNDGEPCEFRYYGFNRIEFNKEMTFNTYQSKQQTDCVWEWDDLVYYNKNEPIYQALNVIDNFFNENDELMEEMLGDHLEVTVTRDGIDVSDYDHD